MTLASSLAQLGPDVLERACAGERKSLEELLRVIQRPFYNLALRMLHDRSLAEDAAQECLLRIVTHLATYRREAKFATWATRVAVNVVFDFKNGLAREAHSNFELFSSQLDVGLDREAPERPEDALLLKQAKKQCNQALLQCLDGDHRIAFVLGDILEFDAPEAAGDPRHPGVRFSQALEPRTRRPHHLPGEEMQCSHARRGVRVPPAGRGTRSVRGGSTPSRSTFASAIWSSSA